MHMDNSNNQPDRLGNQHDPADDNNIMVEDAVSKFTWELSRNGEAQQVNGAVLAVLVSVALENGWKFPSETQPKANFIDLQLLNQLPGHFDDQQARKFSRESLRAIGKQGAETLGAEGAALSELLDFIYRGAFDLKKLDATSASGPLRPMCRILDIPDDLPTPAAKMRVMSLEGEGLRTVQVPDAVLDYWANFETGDPELYLHAIIPDETRHREVILIKKDAWDKASQVLTYFADSSEEVYEDQFQKVLDQILRAEEFKKLTLES